jgi:DNA helicase-2/ATP-dependent DNA helicase PcrA
VRAADLDMLQSIAAQFGSRERFLTELTLDPPQASGDLAGDPLRDEDYLVLSTVHSAKGQEWDAVYVINVNDGNFPNEYATGRAESIDEERRLLYVALTRARDALYLIEPQRYHVTQQPRYGDAYVHGARSRFLTDALLERFDRVGPACIDAATPGADVAGCRAPVDVASRIRQMW